jgi:hypothetical protein
MLAIGRGLVGGDVRGLAAASGVISRGFGRSSNVVATLADWRSGMMSGDCRVQPRRRRGLVGGLVGPPVGGDASGPVGGDVVDWSWRCRGLVGGDGGTRSTGRSTRGWRRWRTGMAARCRGDRRRTVGGDAGDRVGGDVSGTGRTGRSIPVGGDVDMDWSAATLVVAPPARMGTGRRRRRGLVEIVFTRGWRRWRTGRRRCQTRGLAAAMGTGRRRRGSETTNPGGVGGLVGGDVGDWQGMGGDVGGGLVGGDVGGERRLVGPWWRRWSGLQAMSGTGEDSASGDWLAATSGTGGDQSTRVRRYDRRRVGDRVVIRSAAMPGTGRATSGGDWSRLDGLTRGGDAGGLRRRCRGLAGVTGRWRCWGLVGGRRRGLVGIRSNRAMRWRTTTVGDVGDR